MKEVSDNINDGKKLSRKVMQLLPIKDVYPKILIARTKHEAYQYEEVEGFDIAK